MSDTDTNARPGGSITPFWDPPIITSMPHSSVRMSCATSALIASTTKIASVFLTTAATDLTSWNTPVEVSFAWMNTALIFGFFFKAASTVSGFTA